MSRKLFGTDGIRGVANETLTPELAFSLGQAAGRMMAEAGLPMKAIVGRDTRRSGPMLGAALSSGLCSAGVDVVVLGIAPTPAVSFAVRQEGYGLGAVISASHNPAPDNGIKFFGHDGRKLPDEQEEQIEALMEKLFSKRVTGQDIGNLQTDKTALDAYLNYLESIVPEKLTGMKVAVDAANGAAFELGPEILRRLGAEVFIKGAIPDGVNINAECGATCPQSIQVFTKNVGADIGVAFDGDADRAVFSDEKGQLINGDRTLAIWSSYYQSEGKFSPPIVVGTVMSNGGFELYLSKKGLRLERTPVGDKHVANRLEQTGAKIGGEQSGHIIFPEHGPTGDGLTTMLELLQVIKLANKPASAYAQEYEPWPQALINLSVKSTKEWDKSERVASALKSGEERLNGHGRLVVRPSGTQPMIRIMVEASDYDLRDSVAEDIVKAMETELDGSVYSRVDLTHALGD